MSTSQPRQDALQAHQPAGCAWAWTARQSCSSGAPAAPAHPHTVVDPRRAIFKDHSWPRHLAHINARNN